MNRLSTGGTVHILHCFCVRKRLLILVSRAALDKTNEIEYVGKRYVLRGIRRLQFGKVSLLLPECC